MMKKAIKPASVKAATMGTNRITGVPDTPPNKSDKKVVGSTVTAARLREGDAENVGADWDRTSEKEAFKTVDEAVLVENLFEMDRWFSGETVKAVVDEMSRRKTQICATNFWKDCFVMVWMYVEKKWPLEGSLRMQRTKPFSTVGYRWSRLMSWSISFQGRRSQTWSSTNCMYSVIHAFVRQPSAHLPFFFMSSVRPYEIRLQMPKLPTKFYVKWRFGDSSYNMQCGTWI